MRNYGLYEECGCEINVSVQEQFSVLDVYQLFIYMQNIDVDTKVNELQDVCGTTYHKVKDTPNNRKQEFEKMKKKNLDSRK